APFRSVSWAVPAFPGATHIAETRDDCANFHTSACSLPPDPTTKTLISRVLKQQLLQRQPKSIKDRHALTLSVELTRTSGNTSARIRSASATLIVPCQSGILSCRM